jgi:hypothetical protein
LEALFLGQEALWAKNTKKKYNQVGHDESFETGFGQIGERHVDSVPCKFKVKLTFGAQ